MTTEHALDEKIRGCVLDLVESAPPSPLLQLDQIRPTAVPRSMPHRPVIVAVLAIAASIIVLASLLVSEGSSQEVTEAQLGMRLMNYAATTQPVPPGNVPVASGTFFGHPWVVSSVNPSGGRLCVALSYRGSVLFGGCSPTGHKIANPPVWARSAFISSLGTAGDGQRFLVAATNGTVTKLTVRAKGGTFVSATALPEHLGNASYFVLSLGRERDCHGLCQGRVTLSLSTPSGPALIENSSSMVIHDNGGIGDFLNAPVRK